MPRAGTYHKTAKAKVRWHVRSTPEGFLVVNRTTGIPLCGYWSTEAIALKNGRAYFGTEPSTPEVEESQPPAGLKATANTGLEPAAPDVHAAPPVHGNEPNVEPVEVVSREEAVAHPVPGVPAATQYSTVQEAIEALLQVFRAKRVPRRR